MGKNGHALPWRVLAPANTGQRQHGQRGPTQTSEVNQTEVLSNVFRLKFGSALMDPHGPLIFSVSLMDPMGLTHLMLNRSQIEATQLILIDTIRAVCICFPYQSLLCVISLTYSLPTWPYVFVFVFLFHHQCQASNSNLHCRQKTCYHACLSEWDQGA